MTENEFAVKLVAITDLTNPPFECRTETKDKDFQELVESVRQVGIIEPLVIRPVGDAKFEIVAGDRRYRAAKEVGLTAVPSVVRQLSEEQAFLIQSRENLDRVDLTEQEKVRLVTYHAEHFGKKPKEIAVDLGKSYTWVVKYLPDKFKDEEKAEAGKVGGEVKAATQRVAQSPQELVECEYCGVSTRTPEYFGEAKHVLCEKHGADAVLRRQYYNLFFQKEHAKTQAKAPELKEYHPKETPEFKIAQMHPQNSKMELALLEELNKRGLKVQYQVPVCLVQTVLDFVVEDVPFYIDGKHVHLHREWKDDKIREMLTAKVGRTVFALEYERFTKGDVKVLADEIQEAAKF
jgi:ParB/RepB/Spo0J family partition protein